MPGYIPARDIGRDPVPGTGPYVITRYVPGRQVVFARNRYFREWSAAAQPDGSPDTIVWTFGTSLTREITQIETGQADWTNDPLPGIAALAAQFPSQVHISPLPEIVYTAFNTRVPPFDRPRGPPRVQPRRQPQPLRRPARRPRPGRPGLPDPPAWHPRGYQPYCPFTVDPSASAPGWPRPGRRPPSSWPPPGRRACASPFGPTAWPRTRLQPPSWSQVLRELGYRAAVHYASFAAVVQATSDSRRQIQATDEIWEADYPSASDFFDLFFRCSAWRLDDPAATRNGAFYCNPAADRLMNQADSQQATDPAQAAATWAAAAPDSHSYAPLGDPGEPEQHQLPVRPGHQLPVQPVHGRAARPAADTPAPAGPPLPDPPAQTVANALASTAAPHRRLDSSGRSAPEHAAAIRRELSCGDLSSDRRRQTQSWADAQNPMICICRTKCRRRGVGRKYSASIWLYSST